MTKSHLMITVSRYTAILSFAVLSLLAVSGCSDSESPNSAGGIDPKFSPRIAEIVVGDTIRWTMVSGTHTVTSGIGSSAVDAGQLLDENLNQGETFAYVFSSTGSFPYFCRPHETDGMTGTVNVSAATPKTVSVSASGTSFSPRNITIQVGDAVKWTASGSHTVTSGTGSSDPSVGLEFDRAVSSGQTFTFVFTAAGSYAYFCRPHEGAGMKGTVTVTERTSKTVAVDASI